MIPRYTRPEMAPHLVVRSGATASGSTSSSPPARRWSRSARCRAEDFAALRRTFDGFEFSAADVARIEEIERTVKHDVIAFLTFVEEKGGPAARHLHKGMTSSDVLDTTLAVQLHEATALLLAGRRPRAWRR